MINEQPYPLPDGWQWCRLGDVCNYGCHEMILPSALKVDKLLIDLEDIEKDSGKLIRRKVFNGTNANSSKHVFQRGNVLYGKLRPYLNKVIIADEDGYCSSEILPLDFNEKVLNRYAQLFLMSPDFVQCANQNSYGTNMPRLGTRAGRQAPFPLPPLDEQQRIVELLDELFAKLDEAKTLAQGVVDGSKLRRASILHKAFIGELTKLWRDEHGTTLDSWQRCLLGEVCKVNPPKIATQDLSDDLKVSFVPMAAVSASYGEIIAPEKKSLGEVKHGFTNFAEGDVLFAKITPCMENGKAALVGKLINHIGYGSTEFFVLRCGEQILNSFVYHLVRWQIFRDEAKSVMTGAVGQQRVPKSFLANYQLNLPPLEEQKEIVRLLDDLLGKERRTTDLARKTLERIELMKKSILAKAFRGKLRPNEL